MQGAESPLGLEEDGEVEKPAPGQYFADEYERIAVGGAYNQYFWGGLCRARVAKSVRRSNVRPSHNG